MSRWKWQEGMRHVGDVLGCPDCDGGKEPCSVHHTPLCPCGRGFVNQAFDPVAARDKMAESIRKGVAKARNEAGVDR